MPFVKASENVLKEYAARRGLKDRLLRFGIPFLDDAMHGIFPDDLILFGAPSGIGKTQACVNIALANLQDGKRVHFIALEASEFEIERRLKFQFVADYFFSDPDRPQLGRKFNFTDWYLGAFDEELKKYDAMAEDFCAKAFGHLFTFYKTDKFDVVDLTENINLVENDTDLIILDHVHYLDWDEENDNRAIKHIAKRVRSLALEGQKPIVLVAHLRKRDRGNKELVPGIDEFHGSSDLSKIATKIITIAPGGPTADGKFVTYFRIPKNRLDGGVTRYIGATTFDPKKGGYDDQYQLSFANAEQFVGLGREQYPHWARYTDTGGNNFVAPKNESRAFRDYRREAATKKMFNPSEGN